MFSFVSLAYTPSLLVQWTSLQTNDPEERVPSGHRVVRPTLPSLPLTTYRHTAVPLYLGAEKMRLQRMPVRNGRGINPCLSKL